jgi:hypothetical protein
MRAFLPIDFEFGSDLSVKKLHKIHQLLITIRGERKHE